MNITNSSQKLIEMSWRRPLCRQSRKVKAASSTIIPAMNAMA